MRKNKVDVVRGYGKLTGPASGGIHTVAIEGGEQKSIKAKNLVLSTGSVARMLPGMARRRADPDQHRSPEPRRAFPSR